jgi:hypothetical protein
MKIRSAAALLDHLDDEMAWRLKEVHELRSTVQTANGRNIDAHIRAGVSMLYAHWEGFIKGAANAYVSYLAHRGDLMKDLQPCFVALSMRTAMAAAQESSKSSIAISTVSNLFAEMDNPVRFPKSDAISAGSNLSSAVFLNITGWIGIDPSPYATRFTLIDKSLLETRNGIAHGEYLMIDRGRFDSLTHDVLELLRWFKTDIENAVALQSFLKPQPA